MTYKLVFSSAMRLHWLQVISKAITDIPVVDGDIVLCLFPGISQDQMRPEHVVSFACLVEYFDQKGVGVNIDDTDQIYPYLMEQLKLSDYWMKRQNYVKSWNENILNLWRFDPQGMEMHALRIKEYLQNTFFKKKDLSAVASSLTEAFYNIMDHAYCQNAFSLVSFDEDREVLNVAVCDFGIGIPTSVRKVRPDIVDDKQALKKAMMVRFTVKSTSHNAGYGLDNIRQCCTEDDYLWIISNKAALVVNGDIERVYDIGFNFVGTLLLYSISLSHFEDEEMVDDFKW